MTDTSAPAFTSDLVKSSPSAEASYARIMDQLEALEEKIHWEEELLLRLKAEMLDLIAPLEEDKYSLMMLRYFQGKKWEEIMDILHLSRATVFRFHKEALSGLSLPKNYTNINEETAQRRPS